MLFPSDVDPAGRSNSHSSPPSSIANAEISELRADLQGDVLLPEDDAFAGAIACWSLGVRHAPLLVILPETATDVARAVRFARDHDLPVAVQATGHGIPVPCVGGMLINTSRMQGVTIDPVTRTARVEAGAKWARVVGPAHEHGLAPLLGSSSDVGVIGYTLGGGHGWLSRKYGRAADRVLSADLVTANGELLHVTPDSEPDLFWALHGGSGNFGIVTALEFELVPVEQVYGGGVFYPIEDARQVFTAFESWVSTLPDEITASISLMRFPPIPELPPMLQGAACVVVRACAVDELAAGEAAIAPMRALGSPILDTFGVLPFPAIDAISMDPVDPIPAAGITLMMPALDNETVDALLAEAGPGVESPFLMIESRHIRATSAAGEDKDIFSMYAVGITGGPEAHAAVTGAVGALANALAPFASDRVLLNFLTDSDTGEHRTRAAYSAADYRRLQGIKAAYDPKNRFRFNHNIAPKMAETLL